MLWDGDGYVDLESCTKCDELIVISKCNTRYSAYFVGRIYNSCGYLLPLFKVHVKIEFTTMLTRYQSANDDDWLWGRH